jgi:RNA 2',3'-cyclic 3'-phosphodiesterase
MFVAAWPDGKTKERLSTLDLGGEKGLRPVGPERWHVTLRFLGEVDEALVGALADALTSALAQVPGPVRCRLGPATAW